MPPAPDLAEVCLPVEEATPEPADPDCPVTRPAAADALDEALALAKLDRCSLKLATNGYPGGRDPYRLPWFDRAHDFAVNAPPFARTLTTRLDAAARSKSPVAQQLLLLGNRLVTEPLSACAGPPSLDDKRPLAAALSTLIRQAGGTPDEAALDEAAATIPAAGQQALARAVLAVSRAGADWRALTGALSSDELSYLASTSAIVLPGAGGGIPPTLTDPDIKTLLSKTFDEGGLVIGAARLAAALEAIDWTPLRGAKGPALDVKTPLGRIVVKDAGDDTYEDDGGDAICLLVDTGGNDTYRRPVGAVGGTQVVGDEATPIHVAVAIDLGGKDLYTYKEKPVPLDTVKDKAMTQVQRLPSDGDGRYTRRGPDDYGPISLSDQVRQGAARLGYGFLFDLGSDDDHYRSPRMAQGFGCAGVGVLYDQGGSDLYEGEAGVQGSAVFGVGLLLDAAGDDTYKTYADSQGFAYVRAVGALYDGGGADKYLADSGIPSLGGDPIYYSPQTPCKPGAACGNSSFVQGVGFGRRAPGGADNAFMSGGLGVLRDVSGNDVYLASVFAQGSGYWFGTGVLADGAGDDQYDAWWYAQGSDAHAALAIFEDAGGGNDRYDVTYPMNPPYATNTGQGHDYSIGWHLDLGGNDVYRAPGLGLGGGNDNGGGLFVNLGGDDSYEAPGGTVFGGTRVDPGVGRSVLQPCYGLFLDVGGKDTYKVPADPLLTPAPADDTRWTNQRNDPMYVGNKSVGVDRASGMVTLP